MSDLAFGPKQPYEEYFVDFDFVNEIADDDHVESAEVTVLDEDGANVTDDITDEAKQTTSGTKVSIWIMAGETGKTYTLTCQIVTAVLAEKYESEADLDVLSV